MSVTISTHSRYVPSTDMAIVVVGPVLLPVVVASIDEVGAAAPLAVEVEVDMLVVASVVMASVEVDD